MLTNPDGHLQNENSEYIHWLVYVFIVYFTYSLLTLLFSY